MAEREALNSERIREHVIREGGLWHTVRVLGQTGSTNEDVAAFALRNEPEGLVTAADFQTSGRGRFDRQWVSPPRAGLIFSMLLRPVDVPRSRWGWVPLLVGTSLAVALSEATEIETRLKWPNDLLLGARARKAGGVRSELAGDAIVVGVGVNVTTTMAELPIAEATSLELEGAWTVDRDVLIGHVLNQVEHDYRNWRQCHGNARTCGLVAAYRKRCATLGKEVTVTVPGGEALVGKAVDVDGSGGLVLQTESDRVTVAAGDVEHVR